MRIFVCNSDLSGLNKYLISELRKNGHEVIVCNLPLYILLKIFALIISFRLNLREWRRKATENLDKLHKTAFMFIRKSAFFQKQLKNVNAEIDLIFQFSGMFMPSRNIESLDIPYVIYTDYTMKLAEKYPPWTPFLSQRIKWYELEKSLYINASAIYTCSENTKKSFIADYGVEGNKIIQVGCGLTFDEVKNFNKSYGQKIVIFVGLDFERKGGLALLEAFKEVKKVISGVRLVIVGPTKGKNNISEPGVIMLGRVNDREKVKDLFKQASIFVMPSLCEPFGLVLLEAMSYKLPCIGANIDAMPEIIENNKTGFIVEPNNPDALAEKMILLLQNEELMKQMGEAGYARLKERYNWDDVAEKINHSLLVILGDVLK